MTMNTRPLFRTLAAALLLLTGSASAEVLVPARIFLNDGSHSDVLVTKYSAGTATYRISARAMSTKQVRVPKLKSVYFYKPKVFTEAMTLYLNRNYADAKAKFAECEKKFKVVETAPNNYSTLAGFYKMECSRRMFDLAALSSEMEKFRKQALTRETHLQQLEINAFWEAVRLKDWNRLELLAKGWRKRKVSGGQRAQIAYCHGLALEHLMKKEPGRIIEALNTYNRALSADYTASHELVVKAANNALRIYAADPGVKLAMKLWGTDDESKGRSGYHRLLEANALAKLYKQAGFDKTTPLKPEYAKFLKYEASKPGEEE